MLDDEWLKHPLLSAAGVQWKEQDWEDGKIHARSDSSMVPHWLQTHPWNANNIFLKRMSEKSMSKALTPWLTLSKLRTRCMCVWCQGVEPRAWHQVDK